MKILKLTAKNYRNYDLINLQIDQEKKYFIIKALNGSGKTNLLEMIYYFTYYKSFRNTQDSDLIMHDKNEFLIEITYIEDGITNTIKIIYNKKKHIFFNDKKCCKLSDLFGQFISVIFCNSDIDIITGSPNIRRNFFNMFFSIIDNLYFVTLKKYNSILKQKNFILKTKQNLDLLSIYNTQLASCIYYLTAQRNKYINNIKKMFTDFYNEIGNFNKSIDIKYIPSISSTLSEQDIINLLKDKMQQEINLGYAYYGSHRDNYYFCMNNTQFSKYASFGQCRLAALIIKLIQARYIIEKKQIKPVLLFDDVILELDEVRKRKLVNSFKEYNQMFITFTEDIFVDLFNEKDYIEILDLNQNSVWAVKQ